MASAPATAAYIARLLNSSRDNFYFPLYIRAIFTFLRWLPDRWYGRVTRALGRQ
ncbi:MAG: hypothetical protein U5K56_14625 [Halioglobus sp.]|nr:hypothetical protein [Halioglobus sp.]